MRLSYAHVAIASGQSVSGETDLRNFDLIGIEMPAVWTAAGISFKSCFLADGSATAAQGGSGTTTETFLPVVDETGAEISITPAAAKYVGFTTVLRDRLRALGRTKIVSGTNAAPVNQGQNVIVRLILCQTEG